MTSGLTHFDEQGAAHMVDVGGKQPTVRTAQAEGCIRVGAPAMQAIQSGTAKKGDVLGVARIAGIMAAKKTSDIIPLCHPLMLTKCDITFTLAPEEGRVHAVCTVACTGQTGVEMEALHGASAALLTIYDMCKAIDRSMEIENIRLLHKAGGKSGEYTREDAE